MSSIRASRLSLLVACAAIALTGCQTSGPTATVSTPRGDLDALSYGETLYQVQPAATVDRGTPAGRSQANRQAAPDETPPRVIMADGAATVRSSRESDANSGLFGALRSRMQPAAPAAMEASAELPPPPAPTYVRPVSYPAPAVGADRDYRVDAGDKLRIVVFGQEGLTNTYAIDAGGGITMPLIGRVVARGMTPAGLAAHISARLRKGYIREPSVAVEVEAYRPFFILGEVAAPGQYPYVPNMSVEAAVAIAGGFSPRARRDSVLLSHKADGGQTRDAVPLNTPINPGDTVMVRERWF